MWRFAVVSFGLLAALGADASSARAQDIRAEKAVVFAFVPQSGDDGQARKFQEKLIQDLGLRGALRIVPIDSLKRSLQRADLAAGDAIADSVARGIAESFEAKMTVTGSLLQGTGGLTAEVALAGLDPEDEPLRLRPIAAGGSNLDALAKAVGEAIVQTADAHRGIRLGINFYRYQAYGQALGEFARAVERTPDLAVGQYWKGLALSRLDSLSAAKQAFEAAIASDPKSNASRRELANVMVALGDSAGARQILVQMVEANPQNAVLRAVVGYQLAFRLGDKEAGIAQLEQARSIDPEYPDAYKYLALLTDDLTQKSGFLEAYLRRAGRRLDTATMRAILASFIREKQYAEAERLLGQALAEHPQDPALNFYMGYVQGSSGDSAEALRYYTTVVTADSSFAREHNVYLYRGITYQRMGQTAEAEADLSRLAGGDRTKIGQAFIGQTQQALTDGRCSDALDYVNAAGEYTEDGPAVSYFRGAALVCVGEASYGERASVATNQRALEQFREALAEFSQATEDATYGEAASQQVTRTTQLIQRAESIIQNLEYRRRQG
ncbi:MAG: tetratricopeptide repeat protein [Gemmatimonadota bacterium]